MSTLRTPATAAQCAVILKALQAGRVLTPADALQEYGCFRLAARVYDLRQAGHQIITRWQHSGDNKKRWASYILLRGRS